MLGRKNPEAIRAQIICYFFTNRSKMLLNIDWEYLSRYERKQVDTLKQRIYGLNLYYFTQSFWS